MIWQKLQNIKELEINEVKQAFKTTIMSFLNNFLLNILFNQIKILMKFNSTY